MTDYQLSEQTRQAIDKWLAKYPSDQKQSAVIPALHIVQKEEGWLPRPALDAVAHYLEMPPVAVYEVATFYGMYDLKPVGKCKLSVCNSISCMLRGSEETIHYLEERLGIKAGETTADGLFTLEEVECLAACRNAPMMRVNETYYENLTPERIDEILAQLKLDTQSS